jgi:hypothetical protein
MVLRMGRQAEIAEQRARYELLTQREREVLGLVVSGLLSKQIVAQLGTTDLPSKFSGGESCKRCVPNRWRVGADGRKVGHSFSKGLVALYQRVVADPTNSGVSLSGDLLTLIPNWIWRIMAGSWSNTLHLAAVPRRRCRKPVTACRACALCAGAPIGS